MLGAIDPFSEQVVESPHYQLFNDPDDYFELFDVQDRQMPDGSRRFDDMQRYRDPQARRTPN